MRSMSRTCLAPNAIDTDGRHRDLHRFPDLSRAKGISFPDDSVSQNSLPEPGGNPPLVTACEWIGDADLPRVVMKNREGGRLAFALLRDWFQARIGGLPGTVPHTHWLEGAQGVAGDLVLFNGNCTLQSGQSAVAFLALPMTAYPPQSE